MNTEADSIPRHVGLILDGNRRWAREKGLPTLEGHRVGYENIKGIADHAFSIGVEYVSAYIFSTENWNRSKDEVDYLMALVPIVFKKYLKSFKKNEVRIHWLGSYEKLGKREIELVEKAVEETKDYKKGNLCFCFNYSGRVEISEAVQTVANNQSLKDVSASEIEELIATNLYAPGVPDVDLIIRTSGEQRISNFMLWRAAYSEMLFVNKYWPEFKNADFDSAIEEYQSRQRRFGC